jgi:uncharacterized protein with PIN domain
MLVKLGRYLRLAGYDTIWNAAIRTHELILRANAEERIFLTRNRSLAERYPGADNSFVVGSELPVEQFREVVKACDLDCSAGMFSRCVKCNTLLSKVGNKEDIRDKVHPNVYARFDTFLMCPACGQVYWRGSHVRNTLRKLGLDKQN